MSAHPPHRPIGPMVAVAALLLFFAYWLIFALTTPDGIVRGAVQAFNNTLPAIALGWLTHLVLDRYVWRAGWRVRLIAQVPLSIGFALAWYLAILVIRELREGWLSGGFTIRPFVPVAFVWQMFQGVTFYTLAALASLAIDLSRRIEALRADVERMAEAEPKGGSETGFGAATILVRTPDGTEAIAIDDIATISGAGDYSELAIPNRMILTTSSLADFERRLPQDRFFRAHRSHIVRLGAVQRSEPAGNGRTVIHLTDGRAITTSRAGSAALREAAL